MTQRYIHELPGWPKFHWDTGRLTGSLGDTHRQERRLTGLLEALPSEVNRVLEPLIRFTREEAEADTDRMDGMVRAMLLEKPPRENVNPTCQLARGG